MKKPVDKRRRVIDSIGLWSCFVSRCFCRSSDAGISRAKIPSQVSVENYVIFPYTAVSSCYVRRNPQCYFLVRCIGLSAVCLPDLWENDTDDHKR